MKESNMKKISTVSLALFGFINIASANPTIETGFQMGGQAPLSDTTVKETFGKNISWKATGGLVDNQSGFEIRGELGHYSDYSHNAADLGTDLKVDLTNITGTLIYHAADKNSFIRPYLGGGLGAYTYEMSDNTFGSLEKGTRFGTHILGGIQLRINDNLHLSGEYVQHNIPKIFFSNATNFNSGALTVGIGFSFESKPNKRQNNKKSRKVRQVRKESRLYPYSYEEEGILIDLQQLDREIILIKQDRRSMKKAINTFYRKYDSFENTNRFKTEYDEIKFLEGKVERLNKVLKKAEQNRKQLKKQWVQYRQDDQQVETHVTYIQKNYRYSPYHLRFNNRYITRKGSKYRARYYKKNRTNKNKKIKSYKSKKIENKKANIEEKKDFAEKKRQRLLELKNR
jgi:hypothetical protein